MARGDSFRPARLPRTNAAEGCPEARKQDRKWGAELAILLRLLGYVRAHKRYAALTAFFGTSGFLLSFVYPWIVGAVVDLASAPAWRAATSAARRQELLRLSQLGVLVAGLNALVVYGRGHFNTHLTNGIVTDLRNQLFEHLQKLSMGFYIKERSGAILARIVQDVQDATSIVYIGVLVVALDTLQLLLAFLLLVGISPKLTLACGIVFPTYGIVIALMNPRMQRASDHAREQLSCISGNMAERLAGQALIKTYSAEEREAQRFRKDLSEHHARVIAQSHAGHLVASSGEILVHLGTTIVVGYGGWLTLRGELTAGMLTRFLGYVVILYGPVRSIKLARPGSRSLTT